MINKIIFPKPKELKIENGTFTKSSNFVIYRNNFLVNKIVDIFNNNFSEFELSFTKDIEKANFVIDNNISNIPNNKDQGYILKLEDNKITVKTETYIGLSYAILTLSQILKQNSIPNLVIKDYPDIKSRGYIEGFYGYPWSHKERLDLMKMARLAKVNNYIYAPKDDIYHRIRWRDLYPKRYLKKLKELNDTAKKHNIIFTWTLHPGETIDLKSSNDYNQAIRKLTQLKDIGIKRFGILFDDIFKNEDGAQQAEFINKIDRDFIKPNNLEPLIMVGTRYCSAWGPDWEKYSKPLFEKLNDDIEIMWTGAGVMSNIKDEVFNDPIIKTGVKRELSIWWNYPVNDYCDSKLFVDKIKNMGNDLKNIRGFYSNPLHEAYASLISILQIGDYTWNIKDHNPDFSYNKTLDLMGVKEKEAFLRFANNITNNEILDIKLGGPFILKESEPYIERLESFIKCQNENKLKDTDYNAFYNLLTLFHKDYESLLNLENKNLLKDIKSHLLGYGYLVKSGIAILNYYKTGSNKDYKKAKRNFNKTNKCYVYKLKVKDKDKPTSGDNKRYRFVAAVGLKYLRPIISKLISDAKQKS